MPCTPRRWPFSSIRRHQSGNRSLSTGRTRRGRRSCADRRSRREACRPGADSHAQVFRCRHGGGVDDAGIVRARTGSGCPWRPLSAMTPPPGPVRHPDRATKGWSTRRRVALTTTIEDSCTTTRIAQAEDEGLPALNGGPHGPLRLLLGGPDSGLDQGCSSISPGRQVLLNHGSSGP